MARLHLVACGLFFGEKDTGGDITDAQYADFKIVLEALRAALADNGTRVIKTIGHEVLGCIDDSRSVLPAMRAARESISNSLVARRHAAWLKAALHHGEVIEKDGDVFGDHVSLVFRLFTRPPARQGIFFSARAAEALPARDQTQLRKHEVSHGSLKPQVVELLGPPRVYEL